MKIKNFEFRKYCTPAQLYLVIGVIFIIGGFFANYSIEMLLTKALFLVIWAWVLNWLCSKGFKAISWIIVLLPFVFFLFMYFLIKDVVVVKEGLNETPINCKDPNVVKAYRTQSLCLNAERLRQEAVKQAQQKAKASAAANQFAGAFRPKPPPVVNPVVVPTPASEPAPVAKPLPPLKPEPIVPPKPPPETKANCKSKCKKEKNSVACELKNRCFLLK